MDNVSEPPATVRRRSQRRIATPPPSSPVDRRERDSPTRQESPGCASPQCTDCSALLVFLLFNMSLAWQVSRLTGSDLRRLTHGIDFQDQICGMANSTEGLEINGGEFLYWCSQENAVQFDTPICVSTCPVGGERFMCPVPSRPPQDHQERGESGEILIKRVHVKRLVPHVAMPTRQFGKICIPESFSPQRLLSLIMRATNGGSNIMLRAAHLASLRSAPYLMVALTAMAFQSGLMYIFFLRAFMRIFMSVLLILSCSFLGAFGIFLLFKARSDGVLHSLCSAAVETVNYGQPNITKAHAADTCPQFVSAVMKNLPLGEISSGMSQRLSASVGEISWSMRPLLGVALLIIGFCALPGFCYANKQKISLAIGSVRQGCTIVFSAPVLTILPLFECFLRGSLFVLAGAGALMILSTAEVHASPVSILGKTMAGIPRSFSPTVDLVICLATYMFALLWFQEFMSAVFTYIIARTTALSYFTATSKSGRETMLATGCAVLHHLGSFTKGAFDNACRYIPRCFGVGGDDFSYAYVEMAITSSNLQLASSNASKLLSENRLVVATRSMLMGPIMQLSAMFFVAVFGSLVYMLLLFTQRSLSSLQPPKAAWWNSPPISRVLEELAALESPAAAAAVAATTSFLLVQSFTSVINRVADAVLYCSLVEQQFGTISEEVPEAFRNMANYQVNTQHFLCPISHDIMTDPVVAADGHTYDKGSITNWLARSNRSPMTNLPLEHPNLVPNIAIRHQIQALQQGDL